MYLCKTIPFSFDNQEVHHISRNDHYSCKDHTPTQELHSRWIGVLLVRERSICDTEENEDKHQDPGTEVGPADSPVPVHIET